MGVAVDDIQDGTNANTGDNPKKNAAAAQAEAERIRGLSFIDIITNTGLATQNGNAGGSANQFLGAALNNPGLSLAQRRKGLQLNGIPGSENLPTNILGGV